MPEAVAKSPHQRRGVVAAMGVTLLFGLATARAAQPVVPGFYAQFAPGLLARRVTEAPMLDDAGLEIEVWDLLVGPGMVTDAVVLPGAGVLQVRSGAALLAVEDRPQDLRLGQLVAVDEGQSLRFDNSGSPGPLTLRATLIRAR